MPDHVLDLAHSLPPTPSRLKKAAIQAWLYRYYINECARVLIHAWTNLVGIRSVEIDQTKNTRLDLLA